MANLWLRLWHDMPTDPKWRTIARHSKQPISLVQATYIHLLVDASRNVTRGHADVTTEDLASALDCDEAQIEAILQSMQGRVLNGTEVTGWEKRQPKREDSSDGESSAKSAAERKRAQREREKQAGNDGASREVTAASRNVTTDKDKEEDTEKNKEPNGSVGGTDQTGGEQKQQGENSPPLGDNAEGEETAEEGAAADAGLPRCNIEAVVELYHQHLQELPRVRLLNDKRRRAIRKVWRWVLTSKKSDGTPRATTAEEAMAWLAGYFRRASQNDFLMGRGHRSAEHAGWQCDLDFLLTDKGMQHVIEKTKGGAA